MSATVIGSMIADMSANSAAFKRDMGGASRDLRSITGRMNRALGSMDRAFAASRQKIGRWARSVVSVRGAVAGLAGAAGIGALTTQSLSWADQTAKTARAVDSTVESLSALQFQASQTGAIDGFNRSVETFANNLGQLRNRTGPLLTFMREYDRDLGEALLQTESFDDAVLVMADAISQEEDALQRVALARAAFGRSGGALVNTFAEGRAGIAAYRAEAERLGIVLGTSNAEAAERFNDAMDRIQRQTRTRWANAVTEHTDEVLQLAGAWNQVRVWALQAAAATARWARAARGDGPAQGRAEALQEIADRLREERMTVGELYRDVTRAIGREDALRSMQSFGLTGQTPGSFDVVTGRRMGIEERSPLTQDFIAGELEHIARVEERFGEAGRNMTEQAREDARAVAQAIREGLAEGAGETGGSGSALGDAIFGERADPLGDLLEQSSAMLRQRREAIENEGRALFDATRTAAENYRIELDRIAELERQGALTEYGGTETAMRARIAALLDMASATDDITAALEALKDMSAEGLLDASATAEAREAVLALRDDVNVLYDDIRSAGESVMSNAQSEVAAYAQGWQTAGESIRGVIRSIVRELANMTLQRAVFNPLQAAFGSVLDGVFGGSGGAAPLKKFQRGGDFKVGGVGGVDSQLVMFKATPGETGHMRPSGAAGRRLGEAGLFGLMGGGDVHQTITNNFTGLVAAEDFINSVNEAVAGAHNQAVEAGADLALARLAKAQRNAV